MPFGQTQDEDVPIVALARTGGWHGPSSARHAPKVERSAALHQVSTKHLALRFAEIGAAGEPPHAYLTQRAPRHDHHAAYAGAVSSNGDSALGRPTAEARSVDDLVRLARSGSVRMPRFQRAFRWDQQDVERLFDSIWHGYPVGSLLLWARDAPAEDIYFGSLRIEGTSLNEALWVVDGQQRLTTLVATLTGHHPVDPPFELYFDLSSGSFVRRGGRRTAPVTWLPLNLLLDTPTLLDDLIRRRSEGLASDGLELARDLASAVADYRIPLNIVKTDDERVLREIFYRMNSAGHRMTAAEVFRALHAAVGRGAAGDLQTLFDNVNAMGFGALRDDIVVRCVLAVRGGDVYRSFEHEFASGEDPTDAFVLTQTALEQVFAFLREDAAIPHARALPYIGILPILTRFFALHPAPQPRTRNLLRRWLWRGSMAWGRDVGALRRAVQDVDGDEQRSVQRLLRSLSPGEPPIDLSAVQLNKAATRLNLALLSSLEPRDLRSNEAIDVRALLEDDGAEALLPILAPAEPQLAGRILHPPVDPSELGPLLEQANPEMLRSHALSRAIVTDLLAGNATAFLSSRAEELSRRLAEQRHRLAEPAADDHPPISSLAVADP